MNTYILIQKRQDKKKTNKIFIIGVNIDNKSMNNKIYNMHTEAMKCFCVYNTQLFYFSFSYKLYRFYCYYIYTMDFLFYASM